MASKWLMDPPCLKRSELHIFGWCSTYWGLRLDHLRCTFEDFINLFKIIMLFSALSLEEDFVSWREQFWPAVCQHFGVEASGDESRWVQGQFVPCIIISLFQTFDFAIVQQLPWDIFTFLSSCLLLSCCISKKKLQRQNTGWLAVIHSILNYVSACAQLANCSLFCLSAFGSTSWRSTLTSTWTKCTLERSAAWRALRSRSREYRSRN